MYFRDTPTFALTYTDTHAVTGTYYNYYLKAKNVIGTSSFSLGLLRAKVGRPVVT